MRRNDSRKTRFLHFSIIMGALVAVALGTIGVIYVMNTETVTRGETVIKRETVTKGETVASSRSTADLGSSTGSSMANRDWCEFIANEPMTESVNLFKFEYRNLARPKAKLANQMHQVEVLVHLARVLLIINIPLAVCECYLVTWWQLTIGEHEVQLTGKDFLEYFVMIDARKDDYHVYRWRTHREQRLFTRLLFTRCDLRREMTFRWGSSTNTSIWQLFSKTMELFRNTNRECSMNYTPERLWNTFPDNARPCKQEAGGTAPRKAAVGTVLP